MREIARRLEAAGHPTFAVGGAVRDSLLGLPAQDWDLATHARPPEVRKLFRRTAPIGIEHGTVGVMGRDGVLYEVTTFRRDVETFGRHAVVEFADSIEDDLSRRDFTINALAWDPATEELRDPFGGLADLADSVLRTVGEPAERFAEDYLRVLRALRFAGHFRLTIHATTWAALTAATSHLPALSAERVREELLKILGKTRCASAALSLYGASGVLRVLYPELDALVGLGPAEGEDRWSATLRGVDALPTSRPLLRVALLLHAVGMPAARTRDLRGGWRFTGHEQAGARLAGDIARRLKFSNAEVERITRLVANQSTLFPPDARSPVVRRWMRAVGPDLLPDLWRLRIALWRADAPVRAEAERAAGAGGMESERAPAGGGTEPGRAPAAGASAPRDLVDRWRMWRAVRAQRPPLTVADLAIRGTDLQVLGVRPGPQLGQLLRNLLERVLDDPRLNTRDRLLDLAREELHLGGGDDDQAAAGAGEVKP